MKKLTDLFNISKDKTYLWWLGIFRDAIEKEIKIEKSKDEPSQASDEVLPCQPTKGDE